MYDQKKAQEFEDQLAALKATPPPPQPPRDPSVSEPAYDPVQAVDNSQPAESQDVVKNYLAQKYGFSNRADSGAMVRAEQNAADQKALATYGEAGDQIGAAIAGTKSDPTFYREQRKNADDEIAKVQRARKGEMEDMSFKKASEDEDPNGALAQQLRKIHGATLSRIGGDPSILADMSATDIRDFATKPIDDQIKVSIAQTAAKAKVDAAAQLAANKNSPNAPAQRRVGAYVGKAAMAAANDIHSDKNVSSLVGLYENVARGIHNTTPKMTYYTAHEVLQDYARALSGMSATTDSRIAGITPEIVGEQLTRYKTYFDNDPNKPVDPKLYEFLMNQGQRIKSGFQNSIVNQVNRKAAGKSYPDPEMQRSFEGARDTYLKGDFFKKADEQFATDYQGPVGAEKAGAAAAVVDDGGHQVGEVRKGVDGDYKFKGGNWKDKNNWEKVQ